MQFSLKQRNKIQFIEREKDTRNFLVGVYTFKYLNVLKYPMNNSLFHRDSFKNLLFTMARSHK